MLEGLQRWKGKAALVTGASGGIGAATARALAGAGLKVALTARRADRLKALQQELTASGADVLVLPADLRKEEEIMGMFHKARERWGGVDVLINNAGLSHRGAFAETKTGDWREVLETNVLALSICTREALKHMAGKADGAIINISSLAGHRIVPGRTPTYYGASKHAVQALTEGLRSELQAARSPVKLGCISPGMVDTEIHSAANRAGAKDYKMLEPADIATCVLFMLAVPPHVQINDILIRPVGQPH